PDTVRVVSPSTSKGSLWADRSHAARAATRPSQAMDVSLGSSMSRVVIGKQGRLRHLTQNMGLFGCPGTKKVVLPTRKGSGYLAPPISGITSHSGNVGLAHRKHPQL